MIGIVASDADDTSYFAPHHLRSRPPIPAIGISSTTRILRPLSAWPSITYCHILRRRHRHTRHPTSLTPAGKLTVKSPQVFSVAVDSTLPSCSSTSCENARPNPSPPCERVVEPSACRKRSKINEESPAYANARVGNCDAHVRTIGVTTTPTRPPDGVNFTALLRRFQILLQTIRITCTTAVISFRRASQSSWRQSQAGRIDRCVDCSSEIDQTAFDLKLAR